MQYLPILFYAFMGALVGSQATSLWEYLACVGFGALWGAYIYPCIDAPFGGRQP